LRKKRRRTDPYSTPFAAASEPNRVWCGDFKGWSRTQDGERIDPLTITDACTRYLLRCQAVEKTDTARAQAIFEAAFREYGLPQAIRTDNGAPFASLAIAGLSRLALWWMKLGIVPERIQPAHLEQNGRHERMHLTLKQETMSPMAANRRAQQRCFDQFRREYNEQRPHQALDMRTPAHCYVSSPRPYPARVPEPEYDCSMTVRRVAPGGQFSWKHHEVFVSETLQGERIALQPIDDRWYTIYFAQFPLGRFDSRTRTVHRLSAAGFSIADAGEGSKPRRGGRGTRSHRVPANTPGGLNCKVHAGPLPSLLHHRPHRLPRGRIRSQKSPAGKDRRGRPRRRRLHPTPRERSPHTRPGIPSARSLKRNPQK